MKNLLISLIVSAGLMSVAHAGDAEAGKAKSATCAACHGADGNSLAPTFPKIAGQGERYLIKQIKDIRDGNRQVPSMAPFVTGLSDTDIADLAAYFSAQVPTTGGAKEELVELGQRIYRAGIESKGVPACLACHGPDGKGIEAAGFPRLAGQHDAYTQTQLTAFSMNQRTNDGDTRMMRDIAYRLHTTEIEAVSSYIQGLR
ncbi:MULTISPECIES: cytochrome c [unclassified Thalassolituus]|uniref:c-type cytochrome n=1 Tax=Oceanospirillaceae TaxID=135620 RepID=UPI000C60A5A2|nr:MULTISPECIES: c-type cytochrome [unclassified Thalassolituus]MBU2039773.1 cytochrome c4 [Gammaproteobacteria bacterium]MCA6058934.1 cytochrome c4 [Thalassolituus sp. ST750PaO-4]PIQ39948.1 MAG: cytochrome c4 [Thalassolituus sp. CG17_big_fil_post_rev_8_21_14_2_50_53_8]TVV44707.1 cytochrome c4 [Thalassolituus sp. C2-1]